MNEPGAMALFLLMDMVATAAKCGDALAVPFLEVEAVKIMPDGVAIYHKDRFNRVMEDLLRKRL